ncbi:hypothetical protein FDP41_006417 [Naegleria fowleri]|uniref:F-box domain-containing protein n=1 Tax=Naegleria fowleri TaxID=5763 RepID=A0A6A5BL83_NAEFO|nr:uncharacterized protein FDP41_006417 [Naegleria fowleri]KAF0974385.1 hypothetical protein FDP41_006417 [Naegleria fowleri]CAG4712992.1 unnamed protein product [Naegleria fowleri]
MSSRKKLIPTSLSNASLSETNKKEIIIISDDDDDDENESQTNQNHLKRKKDSTLRKEHEEEDTKKRKIVTTEVNPNEHCMIENNIGTHPSKESTHYSNQISIENTNFENPFFKNIPLYQMRIIVSFLDFLSFLKLSQTCAFIRKEYFSKHEFWIALSDQVFVNSLSSSLVFDKSSTESIAVIPNKSSLVTLRSFFSIYSEYYSFITQTSRLILDFDSYMYNVLDKKDVSVISNQFKNLRDLQLLNVKFSEKASAQLLIIKSIISNQMPDLRRLKITFSKKTKGTRSLCESQFSEEANESEFSQFSSCLKGLESFHIGSVTSDSTSSESTWTPQLSWKELTEIDAFAQESLLSFGVESVYSSDFNQLLFGDSNKFLLPRLEELIIGSVLDNCGSISKGMIERASLKKLIISEFLTHNANVLQFVVKNLPNITYMDVKLSSPTGETKPDGKIYLKSDSLRFLKFSDFNKFFDSNLIQLDLPNIEHLSLENFGEISILQEKVHLSKLEIRNSMIMTGQLHSILSKCATSLRYLSIDTCPNVRNIHLLKDPYEENFTFLRHCFLSNCKLLEKVSLACIGVQAENVKYLYMQNLSLTNLQSLREFRIELGTNQMTTQIVSLNLSFCDGLKVLHPETSLKSIQNLTFTGGCDSHLWNSIIQECLKSSQHLKTLSFNFRSPFVHAFAFRLSNLMRVISSLEEFTLTSKFSTNTFMFNFSSPSLKKLKIISENENPVDFYITMPLLESIELTRITNIRIKSNNLTSLSVTNSKIRQLAISSEDQQPSKLENIYLHTVTGDALAKTLSECPQLKHLTLIQVETKNILKTVLPRCELLESLYFSGTVRKLEVIPSLRVLTIFSENLQSVVFPKIDHSSVDTNHVVEYKLATLKLSFCSNLSKIDLKETTLPYLRMVDVRASKVEDSSLKKMISRAPRLTCIRAGNSAVSESFEKMIKDGNRKASFTKK